MSTSAKRHLSIIFQRYNEGQRFGSLGAMPWRARVAVTRLGRRKNMLPFASLHRTNRRRPSGFTLIELLVVIAIISALAAILFPVFAKARDGARKSTAISNLKQIGAALQMYVADYDEHLPDRW